MCVASSAAAQAPERLTDAQVGIVYDQCLSRSAAVLSRTNMSENSIYAGAYRQCIPTRIQMLNRSVNVMTAGAAIKQIDERAKATFPEQTRKVRELRRNNQFGTVPQE
jgi:hypothetical protein